MGASEPVPATLTEMMESTFSDARSNSVQQQRDSADITNQAIEILRGSINAIGDDEKILEGIKMDVHVHREDGNNNDSAAVAMDFFKQDMGDNYGNRNPLHFNHHHHQQQQQQNSNSILEYLHDHDLDPMPIHSSEDNDMSLQLASFNDHDDLWPRPNPVNFNNESRGGNSGVSININIRSSSSNNNENGIDKNEISSSSNNNDNGVEGSGEGVSGGV